MTNWFFLPTNPVPWSVGTAGVRRGPKGLTAYISPVPELVAYQRAVRDEFENRYTGRYDEENIGSAPVGITFYFDRRLDQYELDSGRMQQSHEADATNMQKATEDALQGILFDNDRQVKLITSCILGQGPECTGFVVIEMWRHTDTREMMQSPFPGIIRTSIADWSTSVERLKSGSISIADENAW
jgi:Holliday junction resolvase RusA-like endonuclease